MNRAERRICGLAGFTPAERRETDALLDIPVAFMTAAERRLMERYDDAAFQDAALPYAAQESA
jgi:hypothetical protein